MKDILIIEDDTDINNIIAEALSKEAFTCTQAFSGTEGLLYAEKQKFQIIILDLMLPGLNGEAVLKKIKERQQVPVIVVSAQDSLDSKVNLLTIGADDYITKPFAIQELIARVHVQIRKTSANQNKSECLLRYKNLLLNRNLFSAFVDEQELILTKQEFKILELLISHPERVFSKQDIYDYAWNDVYIGEDKTINVHISNIRKKIKVLCEEEYIETVWGIGFRLAK